MVFPARTCVFLLICSCEQALKPLPLSAHSPGAGGRGADLLFFLQTVTREFNVNPNKTTFGGNCSATLATLELHSENLLLLALQFVMVRAPPPLPRVWDPWPCSSGEAPPSAGPLAP